MRFTFTSEGDLQQAFREHELAAERAVTRGVRAAGRGLKNDWRGQVKSAGLGQRLANTIRGANYPSRGESIGAASLVYARPNRNRGSASAAEVIGAHDRGALIRSQEGFWLAIPTSVTEGMFGGRGRKRISPTRYEQQTGQRLRFVYRRGQPSLLVVDQARVNKKGKVARKGGRRRKTDNILTGEQTVVAFLLVPQVKLRKRMDLDRDRRRWEAALPSLIVQKWPRVNG